MFAAFTFSDPLLCLNCAWLPRGCANVYISYTPRAPRLLTIPRVLQARIQAGVLVYVTYEFQNRLRHDDGHEF